jgi:hypothetical protein
MPPTADEVQIALLRAAGSARRVALARSLTATTRRLSRQALRRGRPNLSETELAVAFVELLYGRDLADGVRSRLQQQA